MSDVNLHPLRLSDQKNNLVFMRLQERHPEKFAEAQTMAGTLDLAKSTAILSFGVSNQKGLVEFTDTVLSNVRSGDAGPAGKLLSELKGEILDLDVDSLPKNPAKAASSFVSMIPFVGGWLSGKIDEARAFLRRYETVKAQIDDIALRLDAEKINQIEHLHRLETLYERNEEYFEALEVLIAAGELKQREMEADLDAWTARLEAQDNMDVKELQERNDFAALIESLDRRLYNLKLARASAVTSGPTIRVAQQGSKAIVETIQESILMMIPEWKKQLVLAISLFDQKRAMALVNETRAMTNDLMMSTANLLGETQDAVKQAQGEGYVKVETLQKITNKLIATIDEGIRMDAENKKKRAAGLEKLAEAETKLKDALKAAQESAVA